MERKMFYDATAFEFKKAAFLRDNLTREEKSLWERLRKKQFHGLRFKCQHPIGNYIADFYCHSIKLVIEVDGENHHRPEQKLHDNIRTEYLRNLGISILRFTNDKVEKDLESVLVEIAQYVENNRMRG
jgi:very-short-patch-repair endonuclease